MVSYKLFQKILIDRNIKKQDIMKQAKISGGTMAKLNTNQYVSLEVIERLCFALECNPGEILEFVDKN